MIDVALPGLLSYQIPKVTDLGLADSVNAPESLLNAVRIPGKVIVDHQMGALEVDTFRGRIVGQKNPDLRVV